jgi:hypothetical protein
LFYMNECKKKIIKFQKEWHCATKPLDFTSSEKIAEGGKGRREIKQKEKGPRRFQRVHFWVILIWPDSPFNVKLELIWELAVGPQHTKAPNAPQ